MSCICFFTRNCANYYDLYENLPYLTKARDHLEKYLETSSVKEYAQSKTQSQQGSRQAPSLSKHISTQEVDNYLNAINLQIEVTKFINNCMKLKQELIYTYKTATLFGNNDVKIDLCCLILLCGQSVQEGFGFVIRIIQCFNLNSTLVYSQIARELAKQYNFKEIRNLLKCINESGYRNEVDSSYDECISTCIRVFAASNGQSANESESTSSAANQQQQQNNKEIEELIQLIKNDENKIHAYILNGRLKSAYLIAIKMDRVDMVKHIANVAERLGQNLIKDICNKWLEKKNPN
jgi:zinc finger FYVE domain-containing protein 26